MNVEKLCRYRMNSSELNVWNEFQEQIIKDCQKIKIPLSFGEFIETQISIKEQYIHTAGYCNKAGYFYINEGDRGELFLSCLSHDIEDIRWYVMEKILRHIGQKLELEQREDEEKKWRYLRKFENGKLKLEENENWIYNTIHDSRKYWFEYSIVLLAKIFETNRIYPYVASHIELMNRWFNVPHWDFDWEKMCFIEISSSQEHD